jgi:hypothetical protein
LGCGGAQADDHVGADGCDFGVEPEAAGRDFDGVWFFVDAAFAAGLPFEMFYGVCYVDFFAVDACFD